jgi:hemerythrin superfamily protein
MSRPIPDAKGLVRAVSAFLHQDAAGERSPYRRFQSKVAIHLLRILEREVEERPTIEAAQLERLQRILDTSDSDLEKLGHTLAEALRSSEMDWNRDDIQVHVRKCVEENLLVSNPRWLR